MSEREPPHYEVLWRWTPEAERWTDDARTIYEIADEFVLFRIPDRCGIPDGVRVILYARWGDRWIANANSRPALAQLLAETDRREAYEAGYRQGWRNGRCDRDEGEDHIGADPGDSYGMWIDEGCP